ncbi:unnamed protein product [marine sediment metagenome]|uniref:Glycosyl transferase family 1 domain-containing protein n=1 Tax=marine sediment metagenome TaxID=412755 RepID=X1PRK5_9ZZZZ
MEDGLNGFLVEPGNPKALAEAMEKILNDENLARRIGEANRKKIVGNYSLDKVVEKYLELYGKIVQSNWIINL